VIDPDDLDCHGGLPPKNFSHTITIKAGDTAPEQISSSCRVTANQEAGQC
jgi:hypothetical protein